MNIPIHLEVLKELEHIVELHQQHGAPAQMDSVERKPASGDAVVYRQYYQICGWTYQ